MAEIGRLELQIEAQATKANQQLDKLIGKLNNVSSSLSKVNDSGLTGLANGVQRLATSMQTMNNVKTADFTRLTKNIEKLGGLNTTNLNSTASAINMVGKAFNNLTGISDNAVQIGEVSKNISKLGNKSVARAIENIPKLTSSLNDMISQLSRAPRVSENIIRMTNAMSNLASQGSKVGSASRSINRGLGNYIGTSNSATKSTKGLASSLGLLYAKFWVVARGLKALWGSIEISMNYLETLNYFEVTVNKIGNEAASQWQEQGYNSAEAYYNSFRQRMTDLTAKMTGFQINPDGTTTELDIKSLGLDPNEILNYQATYAQMANSMGLLEDTALNVSSAFTMLGADWASLKNLDMADSMKKFSSALAGEIEPVRSLGIDIQQTTLQAYALKYGITDNVSAMSQAAKVQLRLLAILDQSKVAMGDMANTLQSPANQLRILKQNFASLARIIGNMILPIVAKVLPYVNGLVIALRRLFTWLSGLMGIDISGLSSSIGDSSLGVSDMADSTDDVADGLEDATKQAEKLKNVTTGIDELNVVSQEDTSSSSGSGSGTSTDSGYGVLDDAITDALADYQALWDEAFSNMENKANGIADSIEKAFKKIYDIAEPTRMAVKKLWDEGLSLFGNFTWTALQDFWSDFLVPLGTWTLGEGLPRFLDITNSFLKDIDWNKINSSLKNFWKALEPFAEAIGRGILNFYEDLSKIGAPFINTVVPGGLNGIANALNNMNPTDIENIAYALTALYTALALYKGVTMVAGIFKGLGDGLLTLGGLSGMTLTIPNIALAFSKISAIGIGTPAFDVIANQIIDGLWGAIDPLIPKWVEKFFGNLGAGMIAGAVGGSWFPVVGIFVGAIIGGIVGGLNGIIIDGKSILKRITDPIFNWDATKAIWDDAKANFKKGGLYIIGGVFEGILAAIGFIIEPIGDFFVAIFDGFCAIFGIHSPAETMKPIGQYIILGVLEGVKNTWTEFATFISGLPQKTIEAFGDIKSKFIDKGKNIIEGIQEGWNNLAPIFSTWLIQKRESVPTTFGSYLDKFVTKGNDMINGIQQGWNNLSANFATWLGQKRESVVTNFGSYYNNFVSKGNEIINGIKKGWENLSGDFSTWLGGRRNDTVSWFGELKSSFVSKGADIISGIEKGWNDNWSSFKDWLGGLPSKIVSAIGSMYDKGKDLISDFIKGFKSIKMPKFEISISYDTKDDSVIGKMWKTLGFSGTPNFGWKFAATGGLPNMGEAFIARENGPEMVGRIGNKSAVVNNDQITSSISDAVVKAMADANISNSNDELLREQNELLRAILEKDTNINLNGRKVNEELTNVKKSNGYSFAT